MKEVCLVSENCAYSDANVPVTLLFIYSVVIIDCRKIYVRSSGGPQWDNVHIKFF
jgi:hypothetical protein